MARKGLTLLRVGALIGVSVFAACGGVENEKTQEAVSAVGGTSTANLSLQELTNSCGANQVQNFFQVTNNGTTPVTVSDVTIKFWADDVSAANLVAQINTGGCLRNANGCFHQVTGVTASATRFSPACGPAPNQQANWEITISNTDHTALGPGVTWSNLQTALHLANFNSFNPGTSKWYSQCLSGNSYADTTHTALYVQGDLVTASTGVPPSCRASVPPGNQVVPGEAAPSVVNGTFPLVGPLAGNANLTVAISLPLQNQSGLQSLLDQIYDPASPLYQQYLKPSDFRDQFGPTQAQYDQLKAYVTGKGLTVSNTYTSRALLNVTGTAAQIEAAFNVTLNRYKRPDGTIFYAPANDPSVGTTVPILWVAGLDNFAVPTPQFGSGPSFTSCPQASGTAGTGYLGNDFPATYLGSTSNTGLGQTVALLEFDGFFGPPNCSLGGASCSLGTDCCSGTCNAGACTAYTTSPRQYANLAHCGSVSNNCAQGAINVTQQVVNGPKLTPAGGEPEVSLGVEMVYAMAPQAAINVYEWDQGGGVASSAAFVTLMNTAANAATLPQVIASTWTWQGSGATPNPGVANVLLQAAIQGQSVFQAAGDTGAYNDAIPASGVPEPIMLSSLMTVVGGTLLTTTGTTYGSEATWNNDAAIPGQAGGGGLCDGYTNAAGTTYPKLPLPRFQQAITGITNPNGSRMIPDVSAVADQVTMVVGQTGFVRACPGGTSASTGLWAGVAADINASPATPVGRSIGWANPKLYTMPAGNLHDVTTGNNNNAAGFGFNAVSGYDLATGLGTPNAGLVGALVPPQACAPGSSLTVLVNTATGNVTAYAPNGSWEETNATGVRIVPLEVGSGSLPAASNVTSSIGTLGVVNTCAGDSVTGNIICTGDDTVVSGTGTTLTPKVYLIQGSQVVGIIDNSANANGTEGFSGGSCASCNVAVDPLLHQAFLSIGTTGGAAIQSLDLTKAFATPASAASFLGTPIPLNGVNASSEAISVDAVRSVVLSPTEENNYQIINPNTRQVFDNQLASSGEFDSAAEDCTTGIALAAAEFSNQLVLVDLNQAKFSTAGSTNTWAAGKCVTAGTSCVTDADCPAADTCNTTAGVTVLDMPELSSFSGTVGGVAATSQSPNHFAIVAEEFGGGGFAVVALPSGIGGPPTATDYVVAAMPPVPTTHFPWQMGRDPHTIAVYTSPTSLKAFGVFQNDTNATGDGLGDGTNRNWLAVVDLAKILANTTPRVAGTHQVDPSFDLVAAGIVRFVGN